MTVDLSLYENLPDPETDKMPPRVEVTPEGHAQAVSDKKFLASLLNSKTHTEQAAKYILEGPLFRGKFRKDGDWATLVSGRQVWQKKIADLVGGIPLPDRPNALTYVEVKGVSPGNSFSFSRLDKPNTSGQPSQQEKMTAEMHRGNYAWLLIGWWDVLPGAERVLVKQKTRTLTKWKKVDVVLTVTLLRWPEWLSLYKSHNYRSIRQRDRHLLDDYRVTKVGGRWTLDRKHWWRP